MERVEREAYCRRVAVTSEARVGGSLGGGSPPFALPGARATWAPDRVCAVKHIKVEVALDFERRAVDGVCTQTLSPLNDGPTRVTLNAVEMKIIAVTLGDGESLAFEYDGKALSFDLGERKQGTELDVIIRYSCEPRRGLYFIHPDDAYPGRPLQCWSQGQDEDNRCWFPCFDHPHEKSTSEVVATVPAHMTALSNGELVSEKTDGERKTFHYRHEVAHSSYLITLVAGEYAVLKDQFDGAEVLYYVTPGREADAPRTFGNTPEMMRLFSDLTGEKYPYPRYAQITVAEFIFGGMENTSATTLTDQTLHDERAHLDFSSEPLISHELAHQWFGDLLTCRDWSHGWLNEGFATYFEILWKEHSAGRDESDYDRLGDMEAYLDEDAHRYRRPVVTNVYHEPIDIFDRHLYEKGGCVLHMLRTELGDARFWKAVRHYVQKHKGGSVETRDLARAVEEATGWNSDRFFHQWVFSAGFPELKAEYSWDDTQKLARVNIKQAQEVKEPTPLFHLPLTLRFVVDGVVKDVKLAVGRADETFLFPLDGKPNQAILDPGNHFLKTLDMKKPDEVFKGELAGAEFAIDRVRAARSLGKAGEPTAVEALVKALGGDSFWAVRGESALALAQIKTASARVAIAAAIKSEAHPKARRMLVRALGAFRHDPAAQEAAAEKLHAGDASYFVEAESALTLAKTRAETAFHSLEEAMKRPSYLDVIESQCLAGMAELRDERGIEVALEAAKYGKPIIGRRAAISALGSLGALYPERKRQILEVLTELLEDPDFRARIAVVEALRVLGESDAIGALAKAERRDLDGRVRRRAREVQKSLHESAAQEEAVRGLRESVEKLESENRDLKERLLKIEARLK
jgi:aminopeptidase N